MAGDAIRQFREWFWRPPRAHGEVIRDRSVSFLELLYDLVYVAVIAQAAGRLAEDVSVGRFVEFAVVFTLIWIAWVNGSLYLELHGREDGRTRSFVFVQMGTLCLLAVFAATAAGEGGSQFAIVYAVFLALQAVGWNSVRGQDAPEVARVTLRYAIGLLAGAALLLASAFLEPGLRLIVWAAFGGLWIAAMAALGMRSRSFSIGITPTHSMVERFGLFVIIVLGEVVFGVVEGLSGGEQDLITVGTGILALLIGLGFWWIYFDIVGRRAPRNEGRAIAIWILAQLPVTLAIAAAGAAMVSLLEHAHDPVAPGTTALLMAGSVALVLVAQIVICRVLAQPERLDAVYRSLSIALGVAAAAALVVGWLMPAPWILALVLGLILLSLWFVAVVAFIRAQAWPSP